MIIEDLVRMARPLLRGGMPAQKVLEMISDVGDPAVQNFYRHVFVVELPAPGGRDGPVALPVQQWGEEEPNDRGRPVFLPDRVLALAAPFVMPRGGNPLNPQGKYGAPVYPVWLRRQDRKTKQWVGQLDTLEQTRSFLAGRLERTPGLDVDDALLDKLARVLHERVQDAGLPSEEKALGLVILVQAHGPDACYRYEESRTHEHIGESRLYPGKYIVPNYERIVEAAWEAKIQEGASKGERDGRCSLCGAEGKLVSPYSKAWPWAFPEWNCPFPNAGDERLWVEGVALCSDCCKALTLGGKLFESFTEPLQPIITRELFSPADDRRGKRNVERRSQRDLPLIRGSAILVLLHDEANLDEETREVYADFVLTMLARPEKKGTMADRYVDAVVGFDLFLKEGIEATDFRLTLVYFHGDPGRGDVHVRAIYEEILPSTLKQLNDVAKGTADEAERIARAIWAEPKDDFVTSLRQRHRSVPYLLGRAYGGAYLWDTLRNAFRRRKLDLTRPVRNSARRMNSVAHNLADARNYADLMEEVVFYLSFRYFIQMYEKTLWGEASVGHAKERSATMPMRPWKEMLEAFGRGPIEQIHYDSPEELGFACGMLLREFGKQYFHVTRRDYLQHRVMTFGSDLSPEAVWKRGLAKVFDVAARYSGQIRLSNDFLQRVGVTLAEFDRLQAEVRRNRDAFMAAFWAGYALQGYNTEELDQEVVQ